jgi:predicted dienelactone hydrolase
MMKKRILVVATLPLLGVICAFPQRLAAPPPAPSSSEAARPTSGSGCPASDRVGFRIGHFGRLKAAVWYPTPTVEQPHAYSGDISSSLAKDGQSLVGCGPFPLIVFSHGLLGCGTQSIFLTETLARHGYVVVAPDHQDALLCSVDGTSSSFAAATEPPILNPEVWNDTSYQDRKNDLEQILADVLGDSQLQPIVDANQIGIAGHSLGGYTSLGMVGGWPTWKDSRLRAALLLSPYTLPFTLHETLSGVNVPLMYQGAQGDIGITPFLEGKEGAFAQSHPPKYFVKLRGGNHFTWTNAACAGTSTIANCLQSRTEPRLINDYAIAFFDQFLKGIPQPLLAGGNDNGLLLDFQHQP